MAVPYAYTDRIDSDIKYLALPGCLERRPDGGIAIAGHRITLIPFLAVLYSIDAQSTQQLREEFPTVPLDTLVEVLCFCKSHERTLRLYFEQQMQFAEDRSKLYPYLGSSLDELRARRARRSQS